MNTPAPAPNSAPALQEHTNELDQELTELARLRRPRVRHWWGRRNWSTPIPPADLIDGHPYDPDDPPLRREHGAWCYLCGRPIATWSSRWPMTQVAKLAILRHRNDHLQGRLDAPLVEPEEQT